MRKGTKHHMTIGFLSQKTTKKLEHLAIRYKDIIEINKKVKAILKARSKFTNDKYFISEEGFIYKPGDRLIMDFGKSFQQEVIIVETDINDMYSTVSTRNGIIWVANYRLSIQRNSTYNPY